MTKDGLVGWDVRLNGLSLSKLGDREGQESLLCCSPWGRKELDKTEWLNNNLEKQNFLSQKSESRTSLAVQRLRLHVSNAKDLGLIPGQETKNPHTVQSGQKKKKKSKKSMSLGGRGMRLMGRGSIFVVDSQNPDNIVKQLKNKLKAVNSEEKATWIDLNSVMEIDKFQIFGVSQIYIF